MESIGARLRAAREQKGQSLDTIARETNIARRYLAALEEEDFAAFPGEPYLLGFLRNYADYLGVESEGLLSLYRTMKIQEQPIPVEQLLKKDRTLPPLALVGIAVAGVGLLVGGLFLVTGAGRRGGQDAAAAKPAASYELAGGPLEMRFFPGDKFVADISSEKFETSVKAIGDAVVLSTPAGEQTVALGSTADIDLNKDGYFDLKVTANDFAKGQPDKGALLRIEPAAAPGAAPAAVAAPAATDAPAVDAVPAAPGKGQVITEARVSPFPFTVVASFKGYCMFRYLIDGKTRYEEYYGRTSPQLTFTANNYAKVWLSNAGAVKLTVTAGGKNVDLDLGGPGEVSVRYIKWVRDDASGVLSLTALPVD